MNSRAWNFSCFMRGAECSFEVLVLSFEFNSRITIQENQSNAQVLAKFRVIFWGQVCFSAVSGDLCQSNAQVLRWVRQKS